ncbi:MAG: cell division protein ZapA [Ruminococcus sp.]|jgi:cell division protein ZapA (FtsZ GTPase activity inhibitor)|nr:cell division protein ZapA [Ruminococcus sp.]
MNKHTVFVAGKRFVLLSDDKENYVQKLASEVSASIARIAEDNPSLDRRSSAILCALDYADDKYKAMGKSRSISDKAQPLIAQADKQSKQLRELKDQVSQRDKMIENYRKELETLKAADKEQKDKIKKLSDELDIRTAQVKELQSKLDKLNKSDEKKPEQEIHIPSGKKYDKPEKKNNKIDITEDDELEESQLFSLFD